MVRHNETGLIVPLRDEIQLAHAIRYYLENPDAAREIGARAMNEARSRYSKSRYVEQLMEIYKQVIYGRAA